MYLCDLVNKEIFDRIMIWMLHFSDLLFEGIKYILRTDLAKINPSYFFFEFFMWLLKKSFLQNY